MECYYYPFEIAMPNDPRVGMLRLRGGMAWAGMWYELLAMMWQSDVTETMLPFLAHEWCVDETEARDFVDTCSSLGLINADAWANGRIINNGIIRRKAEIEKKARAGKASGESRRRKSQGKQDAQE